MEDLCTNLDLFVVLKHDSLKNNELLYNTIISKLPVNLTLDNQSVLRVYCRHFCYNIHRRWVKSGSKTDQFLKANDIWLESPIQWPKCVKEVLKGVEVNVEAAIVVPSTSSTSTQNISVGVKDCTLPGTSKQVSSRKLFSEIGPKQKKRRTEQIREEYTSPELAFATSMRLKANGNQDVAEILDFLLKNPNEVPAVKAFIAKKEEQHTLRPDKALGGMLSTDMTKWQYNAWRAIINETGANILPSYYKVQQTKYECYPPEDDILITESEARIKLQSLLNLTAQRILKIINAEQHNTLNYKLESKWGLDGASNQSNYKQISVEDCDDSCVYMASLVPIRLMCGDKTLWVNDKPNSTKFCRPIFFKFIKETSFNVMQEVSAIQNEIQNLVPTSIEGKQISHALYMTMIDGKTSSILTETSSQRCDICNATPKEMSDLTLLENKQIISENYKYGLSTLHAWIRMMEFILHIAYKLNIKKYHASNPEEKAAVERRKHEIIHDFRTQTGLLLDIVKQGHGTTNDGNSARRFFGDSHTTAAITGVDQNLIHRLSVVLETISSGQSINIEKFKEYTKQTYQLYIHLYNWYYMPPSVHKILAHGAEIIESFGLMPIGQLSEEASEARNKDYRAYRRNHTRKFSRVATNEDTMHHLLLTSDPWISTIRPKLYKTKKAHSEDVKNLLISENENKENVEFIDVENMSS